MITLNYPIMLYLLEDWLFFCFVSFYYYYIAVNLTIQDLVNEAGTS